VGADAQPSGYRLPAHRSGVRREWSVALSERAALIVGVRFKRTLLLEIEPSWRIRRSAMRSISTASVASSHWTLRCPSGLRTAPLRRFASIVASPGSVTRRPNGPVAGRMPNELVARPSRALVSCRRVLLLDLDFSQRVEGGLLVGACASGRGPSRRTPA